MTMRPDGLFDRAVRLADRETPFRGAVTALGSGAFRHGGTFGDGAVTLTEFAAGRTMKLVPDGGGGVVAVAAGVLASSVALVGFGVDSFVETASGLVEGWRGDHAH